MPPTRRRPSPTAGQAPPIRRPKVAGRRNRPAGSAEDAELTQQFDAVPAEPEPEPEQDDDLPTSLSGDVIGAEPEEEPAPAPRPKTAPRPRAKTSAKAPAKSEPKVRRLADGDRRPAGKRRATGSTRPASLAAAEADTGTDRRARRAKAEPVVQRSRASRHLSAAIVIGVVALVLAGLAAWFRGEADNLTSGDTNSALTDPAQTSQAVGQIKDAIEKTFSYNYTDLGSTQRSVETLLTGTARCEYDLLFKALKEQAPAQQSVLATTVRDIALVRLEGDRAEALVFIDQSSTRADVNNSASVGAQFGVQAQKQGDQWKITQFNMFGQPLVDGKPVPEC